MFNPYTWTSQITKPERNETTISCTQNYETSTGIAIPTSSHLTHKLKSLFTVSPSSDPRRTLHSNSHSGHPNPKQMTQPPLITTKPPPA